MYRLPLPLALPDDEAERLADLGEAVAGLRVTRLGTAERLDGYQKLQELARGCGSTSGIACDVVRWMRTPQTQRSRRPPR